MRWLAVILLSLICTNMAFARENLVYLTNDLAGEHFLSEHKLKLIEDHHQNIDILAPQVFSLNEQGHIVGHLDEQMFVIAKKYHIKVMPLVINANFDQEMMHRFLNNDTAKANAIQRMINLARENDLYGWQFDFENINIGDKAKFTEFFKDTARALHREKYTLSIAIVPHTTQELKSPYDRYIAQNWSGAFDYKPLGQYADFVTIMSYDNHTSLTTPGPIAPYAWVNKTLKVMLKDIPANKISLGLPAYSGFWHTAQLASATLPEKYSYRSKESQISYRHVISLIKKLKAKVLWNKEWQASYSIVTNDDKLVYLFIENAASFNAKHKLIQKYHLRGFSLWQLNMEDPLIWQTL